VTVLPLVARTRSDESVFDGFELVADTATVKSKELRVKTNVEEIDDSITQETLNS